MSLDIPALRGKFGTEDGFYVLRQDEAIQQIFSELYQTPPKIRMYYFKIKIIELLLRLAVASTQQETGRQTEVYSSQTEKIKAAHQLMEKHLSRNYTTEELARSVGMSASALKIGFKNLYGSPIYTYIRRHKMNVAASMLRKEPEKRVIDVAASVGYDNPSKFAAAFKEIFSMTPAEYRNSECNRK